MESYENEELRQEPEYIPPQAEETHSQPHQEQPYSGSGVGRKESPFADSPYVLYGSGQNSAQQPRQEQSWQESYRYQPQNSYIPPEQPPVKPPKAKKRSSKGWKTALCAVLILALVAGSCGITAMLVNNRWEKETDEIISRVEAQLVEIQAQADAASNAANQALNNTPQYVVQDGVTTVSNAPGAVYASNVQSVVLITCEVTTSMYGQNTTGLSTGSGFILSEDGYIITNHHVVEGASKVTVTTHNGAEYSAHVIGSDETNDVAVLKAEADRTLSAVSIGSSDNLLVGDQVVAIGNPLGELTSTLTVGYVSAKERDVTTDGTTINMIQTDAAINSGNSGGPLFNMNGEVVGITTAKYSGASSSGATIEGIGFAIPIDDVMPLVEDLIEFGYVTGAYLGVMVSDMDSTTASYYGLPVGAYVQEVTPGNCAEAAGVQAKDIIIALGDHEIGSLTDLTRALREFEAGDTTTITVYRSGKELTLPITLDEKPQTTTQTPTPNEGEMPQNGNYEEWYNYFAPFFGNGNG